MGLNNLSSINNYFATDYMLETIFFVYCLLFINTFYLYKLDARALPPLSLNTPFSSSLTVSSVNNYSESINSSPPTALTNIYSALNPWFVTGFAGTPPKVAS